MHARATWTRGGGPAGAATTWQLGFVEPYLFDKQILLGGEVYRRDYNSFNFVDNKRNTTYSQMSTGTGLRVGFPVTEFVSFGARYSLVVDKISLNKSTFYTDPDGNGPLGLQCDPVKAGRYLCDEIGSRVTSLVGYSLLHDDTNGIRPTHGQRLLFSQDFAGLRRRREISSHSSRRDEIQGGPLRLGRVRPSSKAAISSR